MASFINTNIASLNSQRSLTSSQGALQTSLQRLSSGLRINSAKDDSAGMAISTRMTAQINGMNQASRNANDAISMSQTAEGSMGSINDILLRMRDLSVQAANGSNGDKERASIQTEVDQLYSEIDRISSTTNFNGVKLLDGSAKGMSFQVGADANQTISFGIGEVSTKSMALNSTSALGGLNGGRVTSAANSDGTITAATTGDLVINGTSVTFAGTDNSIGEFKNAINAMSGSTGVTASAYNIVKGTTGATGITSGLTIRVDAASTGAAGTAVTIDNSTSMSDLVDKINKQVGGVTAAIGTKGELVLSNDTGAKITIGETTAGAAAGSGLTVSASGNQGYLSLTSANGSAISVGVASGTAASALDKFGFNASTGSGVVTSRTFLSAAADTPALVATALDTAQGKLTSSDSVSINGVKIGTTGASAAEKASAINAVKSQTGVTANATTTAYVDLQALGAAGSFTINGATITLDANDDDTAKVVTKINAAGISGLVASTDAETGRLVLNSSSGNDIIIGNAGTDTIVAKVADTAKGAGTAVATGGAAGDTIGVRGTITLSGENGASVRLEEGVSGSLAKLGLVGQGGSEEAVGGKLSVTTAANAQSAIKRIDSAIDFIANQRATMGAVQNRFTSTIANLATSVENISASRSRIQDADFAAETANMTRAQILQQAGTAMLAQANSLPNGVLSLLRG